MQFLSYFMLSVIRFYYGIYKSHISKFNVLKMPRRPSGVVAREANCSTEGSGFDSRVRYGC